MPINPNSAFTRVFFDLPTQVAIQLDEIVRVSGKSKRQYITDVISQHIAAQNQPAAANTSKTKGRK